MKDYSTFRRMITHRLFTQVIFWVIATLIVTAGIAILADGARAWEF